MEWQSCAISISPKKAPEPPSSFTKKLKVQEISAQFSANGFQTDFCTNWGWIDFLLNGAPIAGTPIPQWGLFSDAIEQFGSTFLSKVPEIKTSQELRNLHI